MVGRGLEWCLLLVYVRQATRLRLQTAGSRGDENVLGLRGESPVCDATCPLTVSGKLAPTASTIPGPFPPCPCHPTTVTHICDATCPLTVSGNPLAGTRREARERSSRLKAVHRCYNSYNRYNRYNRLYSQLPGPRQGIHQLLTTRRRQHLAPTRSCTP